MNDVRYDLRAYGFCTKVPLVTKDTQWRHYFDEKFANIDIDIDPQEIKETIVDQETNRLSVYVRPLIKKYFYIITFHNSKYFNILLSFYKYNSKI